MNSGPEKPGRLQFLNHMEPWPPEPRDIREMRPLGPRMALEPSDVEPVDLEDLAKRLKQTRIRTIAEEMVALTFGEMVEYTEAVIEARGDNTLPDKLTLATILHAAAKNLLDGSTKSVAAPIGNGRAKNGRNKAKDESPPPANLTAETPPAADK